MGNSLRCCLACVIPCGALDLIRIVHLNGYVEEMTGPVTAGEFLKAYPNQVLTKPSSQGMVRKILILSPETQLKRGSIYFSIPQSSMPSNHRKHSQKTNLPNKSQKLNDDVTVNKSEEVNSKDIELSMLGGSKAAVVSHTKSQSKSKSGDIQGEGAVVVKVDLGTLS